MKLPKGLYAITAEDLSNGRDNITVVKEMLAGGVKIIQYRDKHKTKLEKFDQCKIIRRLTKEADCCFIVNDDIDIALAVSSDGVHLGQDDLPIDEARKILAGMIIGLSTHSPDQARKAQSAGADYIGVGPIFKTFTKENVCPPVGLGYLDFCMKEITIPRVAIGGIKLDNIGQVLEYKPDNIAMVTQITQSIDISKTVKKLRELGL